MTLTKTATVPNEIREAVGDAQVYRYGTGTYGVTNTDVVGWKLDEYSISRIRITADETYIRIDKQE